MVFTGAASSVVGMNPGVYEDPLIWADHEEIQKPNEKANIVAERIMWNAVTKRQNEGSQMNFCSILPYFMVGPPLMEDHVGKNSSCMAISSIMNN
jgi:hypothetical protein